MPHQSYCFRNSDWWLHGNKWCAPKNPVSALRRQDDTSSWPSGWSRAPGILRQAGEFPSRQPQGGTNGTIRQMCCWTAQGPTRWGANLRACWGRAEQGHRGQLAVGWHMAVPRAPAMLPQHSALVEDTPGTAPGWVRQLSLTPLRGMGTQHRLKFHSMLN